MTPPPAWYVSSDTHTRTLIAPPFQLQVVASTHNNDRPGIPSGHVSWSVHFVIIPAVGRRDPVYVKLAHGDNGDKLPRGTGITNRNVFVQRLMDEAQVECIEAALAARKELARLIHAWRIP